MRLEFNLGTPLLEQRMRVAGSKQPGRKHQKRKGAKSKEKDKATNKRRISLKAKMASKLKAAVAAYWRGELDTFPLMPNYASERPAACGRSARLES